MNIEQIMMQVADRIKDFMNQDEVVETTVSNESELIATADIKLTDLSELSDEEIQERLPELIEYSVVAFNTTDTDVKNGAEESDQLGLGALTVTSATVPVAHKILSGTGIDIVAAVGYPHGGSSSGAKGYEAKIAIDQGADRVEMVLNPGFIKDKNYQRVLEDISTVVKSAAPTPVVISLYPDHLSDREKMIASVHAQTAGARGVQLIFKEQPVVDDIQLIRETIGSEMALKVTGTITSEQEAFDLLRAGASAVGISTLFPIEPRESASEEEDEDYNAEYDMVDDDDDIVDSTYDNF